MTAIVFVSGLAADRRFRLGGVALLERLLIVAARAGVRRCLVAGTADLPRRDARMPRLTPVADLADALAVLRAEGTAGERRVLLVHAGVVTHPAVLRAYLESHAGSESTAPPAPPLAIATVAAVGSLWEAFLRPEEEDGAADAGRSLPPSPAAGAAGLLVWVRRAEQTADVERALLRTLDNPRDGRVDTLLNRRLSRPLSRLLLALPLTANHVTILSFVAALLAAMAFARGTYEAGLVGAALFQFAAVLDCCDGEVARVKLQESALGDALDISLDAVGNLALFVGIARGAHLAGRLPDVEAVTWALGLAIAVIFPLVTWIERRVPSPAPNPDLRRAQSLVAALSSRDFSLVVALAALTSMLPWFLRAAAGGAHLFWIALLVLLVRGRSAAAA
jgi:phosphatidylglycerophosphate synthase